jgi:hypothetical protein
LNTTGSSIQVYAGTVLQPLPHLKAEKMKSISSLVNSVLNQKFVNGIVSITTDALLRMEVGIHVHIPLSLSLICMGE